MTPTPIPASNSFAPSVSLPAPLCVVFLRFLPFKTSVSVPPSLSFQPLPDTFLLFGGGYTFLTERSANQRDLCSLFSSTSALFQVTYPVTPLLATLTKTWGVYTNSSQIGTRLPRAHSSRSGNSLALRPLLPESRDTIALHSPGLFGKTPWRNRDFER